MQINIEKNAESDGARERRSRAPIFDLIRRRNFMLPKVLHILGMLRIVCVNEDALDFVNTLARKPSVMQSHNAMANVKMMAWIGFDKV